MRCRKYVEQTTFIVLIPILISGLKFSSNCFNFFSNVLVIFSFLVYKEIKCPFRSSVFLRYKVFYKFKESYPGRCNWINWKNLKEYNMVKGW